MRTEQRISQDDTAALLPHDLQDPRQQPILHLVQNTGEWSDAQAVGHGPLLWSALSFIGTMNDRLVHGA
jgi:hypothetical protein